MEHLNAIWFDSRKVVYRAATGLEKTSTTTEIVLITGLTAETETLDLLSARNRCAKLKIAEVLS